MEGEVEPHVGRRGVLVHLQLLGVEGVDGEDVPVRPVAGRWRGAAVAALAEVVTDVERPAGEASVRRSRPAGKLGGGGREVDQHPVPEAAAGRRVRVVDGDDEPARAARITGPAQLGRPVSYTHLTLPT